MAMLMSAARPTVSSRANAGPSSATSTTQWRSHPTGASARSSRSQDYESAIYGTDGAKPQTGLTDDGPARPTTNALPTRLVLPAFRGATTMIASIDEPIPALVARDFLVQLTSADELELAKSAIPLIIVSFQGLDPQGD